MSVGLLFTSIAALVAMSESRLKRGQFLEQSRVRQEHGLSSHCIDIWHMYISEITITLPYNQTSKTIPPITPSKV